MKNYCTNEKNYQNKSWELSLSLFSWRGISHLKKAVIPQPFWIKLSYLILWEVLLTSNWGNTSISHYLLIILWPWARILKEIRNFANSCSIRVEVKQPDGLFSSESWMIILIFKCFWVIILPSTAQSYRKHHVSILPSSVGFLENVVKFSLFCFLPIGLFIQVHYFLLFLLFSFYEE